MRWADLLFKVAHEPVFRTGFLAANETTVEKLRLQLTRWVKTGRLIQLKKGLYTLAEPYRQVVPYPFVLASEAAAIAAGQGHFQHVGILGRNCFAVSLRDAALF